MMTRRTFALLVAAVVLFAAASWGGFYVSRSVASRQQLAQPGWCCIAGSTVCQVAQGNDECVGAGGTLFNWNQDSCNAMCAGNPVRRSSRKPSSSATP
jgi:hypothetical protein